MATISLRGLIVLAWLTKRSNSSLSTFTMGRIDEITLDSILSIIGATIQM